MKIKQFTVYYFELGIWAATWQNQQSECAPSEDSDQPGHPPSLIMPRLIRVFAVRIMGSLGPKLSSCGQRRLWSDWADAQADLSLRWQTCAQPFCWFCCVAAHFVSCLKHVNWMETIIYLIKYLKNLVTCVKNYFLKCKSAVLLNLLDT